MRLGMFMMPLHPAGRPLHAYLAEDTEKALLLEKLGFDELFVGEHFSAATEPYPSPLMFAASLLTRTERLVFGTGVISGGGLRHPALIAAECAQFDHMAKGRFILGIGTGSTPTDIELFGSSNDSSVRGKMLLESIDMIEKIWSSEPPYDFKGLYWNTKIKDSMNTGLGFGWLPKPYQKRVPIVIPSSTPESASVKVAGRRGWGVISSQLLANEGVANHWKQFQAGAAEDGRIADANDWRVCRSVFVAGSDEEARQRIYHPESGYRHFFGHMHKVYTQVGRLGVLKSRPDMRDDEITVDTFIDKRTIFGSPKTVLNELIALRKQVGPFGSLLLTAVDWAGPNAAWERESLSRIAQEVMPAFRQHIASADAVARN